MESPLLPISLPTHATNRQTKAKRTPMILVCILVGMTIVNFVNFTNPSFTSGCLHAVHDKLAGWTSYSSIAAQFLKDNHRSAQRGLRVDYAYEPLGQQESISEPGINAQEPFDIPAYLSQTADSTPRRMTGEPGIDFWDQSDVDEDLSTIFSGEEFVAQDSVRYVACNFGWHSNGVY